MTTILGKQVHPQGSTKMILIKQVLVTSSRQDHKTNQEHIPATTVSMATKVGRMVTNLEGLLPVILFHPLIMQSCEIT